MSTTRTFTTGSAGGGASPLTTKGDLYTYAAADERLATGAFGQVLTADTAESTGLKWVGGLTLIGTATVSGAAATTLTLSGLDLSLYKHFWLVMALDNATASAPLISMYYNGDTTATNYHRQSLSCSNTTLTGGRANDGVLATLAANETQTMIMFIANDRDGKPRNICYANRDAPATVIGSNTWHCWTTVANVTSITMSSSVASALAVGSTFSVWGVV